MKNRAISTGMDLVLMPVQKVRTRDLFMDSALTVPSEREFSVIRDSHIYGQVSANFNVIQPSDFHTEVMNALGERKIDVVPSGRFDSRGNWEIRYSSMTGEWSKDRKVGDEINPFVSFGNGLAGTKSGSAGGGALRLKCTNGQASQVTSQIFNAKVRNTKNTQNIKLGIDFDLLIDKYLKFFESFQLIVEEQERQIEMEFKLDQVLPVFYELTKGTLFPTSKFQTAFDRIAMESKDLGYTEMNRYLAYTGLNYILEHDSQAMDLNKVREIDQVINSRIETVSIPQAMKNFNGLVKAEKERVEIYQGLNNGNEPRGKKKVLELDLSSWN